MSTAHLRLGTWSKAKHAAYYSAITAVLLIDMHARLLWPCARAAAAPLAARLLNILIPSTAILSAPLLCHAALKARAVPYFPFFNIAFSVIAICDFLNMHFNGLTATPTAQGTWFLHAIMWQLWLCFMDVPTWGLMLWESLALPLLLLADQHTMLLPAAGAAWGWRAGRRLARAAGLCATTLAMPLLLQQLTKRSPVPPAPAAAAAAATPPPASLQVTCRSTNRLARLAVGYLAALSRASHMLDTLPGLKASHAYVVILSCTPILALQGSVSVLQALRGEAHALYPMILMLCGYLLGTVEGQLMLCIQGLMEKQLRAAQDLLYDLLPKMIVSALLDEEDAERDDDGGGAAGTKQPAPDDLRSTPRPSTPSASGSALEHTSSRLRRINVAGGRASPSQSGDMHTPVTWVGAYQSGLEHAPPLDRDAIGDGVTFETPSGGGGGGLLCRQDSSSSTSLPSRPSTTPSRAGAGAGAWAVAAAPPPLAMFHDSVSVLFCDIVGFSTLSRNVSPEQVMSTLNDLYSRFDLLSMSRPVYKVETIGDSYMAATGLLHDDPQHVRSMLEFALAIQHEAAQVPNPWKPHKGIEVRIGVHSGPCLSGVVGRLRKRYCLFGDTVNTASRMESGGQPGRIHISSSTYKLLHEQDCSSAFDWECCGAIDVKGLGAIVTYLMCQPHGVDRDVSPPASLAGAEAEAPTD